MNATTPGSAGLKPRPFYTLLYVQVAGAILLGALFGALDPAHATTLKFISDGFIKILRLMLPPIIFITVALGIAGTGDLKKVGRVGVKALLYFEIVTTAALGIGLLVVHVLKPGAGLNVDPSTLSATGITAITGAAKNLSVVDYLLGVVPAGVATPFVENNILQVLLLGCVFGIALAQIGHSADVVHRGLAQLSAIFFVAVGQLIRFVPLAAFAAMAFTIGKYGLHALVPLGSLIACFYLTSIIFILVVLGGICAYAKVNILKVLRLFKDELLIVLGTSASESVLPLVMQKLERLGCSKGMVGFVLPAGYTFNLDGASIYLTMAFIFIAQATNTTLTWPQELMSLGIMLLTSKGSAGVPGGGFVALAATLVAVNTVPVAGLTLLIGIDSFMSAARAVVNVTGNIVATIVVSQWEGEFDARTAETVLNGGDVKAEP